MRDAPVHTSRDFETELRELRAQLQAMGARCERIVGLAIEAFRQGDADLLAALESLDMQIDRDAIAIHALVLRVLALRQPVAEDLRLLATALRLIIDLECVGDEAINVGERVFRADGVAKGLVAPELAAMERDVRDMLHVALDAMVQWDDALARGVLERDDAVDAQCSAIIEAMTTYMSANPGEVRSGLRVIRVAKCLERIADHATNVAEEVIFMVRADDVRHRGGLRVPSRLE